MTLHLYTEGASSRLIAQLPDNLFHVSIHHNIHFFGIRFIGTLIIARGCVITTTLINSICPPPLCVPSSFLDFDVVVVVVVLVDWHPIVCELNDGALCKSGDVLI